jgi:hypothetical protein
MTKTVTITLEQAETAIECIDGDIMMSERDQHDYTSIEEMTFHLRRAELRQRLMTAIKANKEIK